MRATTGSRARGCSTRSELAAGNLRLLYLGWLLTVQPGGLDEEDDENLEDEVEPPVPVGLKELSDSLASVAEFLKIDDDLIEVAAEASGRWCRSAMTGSRTGSRRCRPAGSATASAGRTASELLAGAKARRVAREEAEARHVREHLYGLDPAWVIPVAHRLRTLDDAVAQWEVTGREPHDWGTKVTSESQTRRLHCMFTDLDDERRLFELHARFTPGAGRIHVLDNADTRTGRPTPESGGPPSVQ